LLVSPLTPVLLIDGVREVPSASSDRLCLARFPARRGGIDTEQNETINKCSTGKQKKPTCMNGRLSIWGPLTGNHIKTHQHLKKNDANSVDIALTSV
jgi:hypothetical protein